jgi:hypothetical protein
MQNPSTKNFDQALAANSDTVYGGFQFEHTFDMETQAASDEQVQAETTPHRLTQMATAGAGTPTSTEDFAMNLSTLRQQYTAFVAQASVLGSSDKQAAAALVCARHAAAYLVEPFADVPVEVRCALIREGFQRSGDHPQVDEFWTLLSNLLCAYQRQTVDSGWTPAPGFLPEDDALLSLPVWLTDEGRYVSDLLVFMTPWDTEEDIHLYVDPAMDRARKAFGDEFGGIRLVPPLSSYLTRWYHPDGTWEMWFEDVPNFYDLLDEALSEAAES